MAQCMRHPRTSGDVLQSISQVLRGYRVHEANSPGKKDGSLGGIRNSIHPHQLPTDRYCTGTCCSRKSRPPRSMSTNVAPICHMLTFGNSYCLSDAASKVIHTKDRGKIQVDVTDEAHREVANSPRPSAVTVLLFSSE